ncbi:MAG: DNA gyrase subunit A, partial [Oxalobacteraceae bacterium]
LREWIAFRFITVTRRTEHRLNKVDERIHILEGREAILLNIDKVIKIIRESDEPKPALIAAFALSDRQAEDILEIRLRQLARLESIKIQQELATLRSERAGLQELLDSPAALKKCIIREIEADAKQFSAGDQRRTLIEVAEKAVMEQKVVDEAVTLVISQKGWVRARTGHGHDAAQFAVKAGDALYGTFECRSIDNLLVFGTNGRVYSVAVAVLPNARGDGMPITTFIDLASGTRILHYFAGAANATLLLASDAGYGFSAQAGDMVSRNKSGKAFITLEPGDTLLPPCIVKDDDNAIACLSAHGRLLVFGLAEIKTLSSGGRGVILMGLDAQEKLLAAQAISQKGLIVSGIGRANKAQAITLNATALAAHIAKRARKGKALESKIKAAALEPIV